MRLWAKQLVGALPREQLVSQWRECSSIAGAILKNGTPNHLLVNFVLAYGYDHFISYCKLVRDEMTKRDYRTMDSVWGKIISLKSDYKLIPFEDIYKEKMNDEYLTICYYNLYEKYLCGGIDKMDMMKIKVAIEK